MSNINLNFKFNGKNFREQSKGLFGEHCDRQPGRNGLITTDNDIIGQIIFDSSSHFSGTEFSRKRTILISFSTSKNWIMKIGFIKKIRFAILFNIPSDHFLYILVLKILQSVCFSFSYRFSKAAFLLLSHLLYVLSNFHNLSWSFFIFIFLNCCPSPLFISSYDQKWTRMIINLARVFSWIFFPTIERKIKIYNHTCPPLIVLVIFLLLLQCPSHDVKGHGKNLEIHQKCHLYFSHFLPNLSPNNLLPAIVWSGFTLLPELIQLVAKLFAQITRQKKE